MCRMWTSGGDGKRVPRYRGVRLGAAVFIAGLSWAGPQTAGIAVADRGGRIPGAVSDAAGSRANPDRKGSAFTGALDAGSPVPGGGRRRPLNPSCRIRSVTPNQSVLPAVPTIRGGDRCPRRDVGPAVAVRSRRPGAGSAARRGCAGEWADRGRTCAGRRRPPGGCHAGTRSTSYRSPRPRRRRRRRSGCGGLHVSELLDLRGPDRTPAVGRPRRYRLRSRAADRLRQSGYLGCRAARQRPFSQAGCGWCVAPCSRSAPASGCG